MSKPVAVVLSGCGFKDGSEIHEAVSCLVHLSRRGLAYRCFAPDAPQARVVNHATGKDAGEKRNMMVEAARIARGVIEPLSSLRADGFDALVFPGGFGAATNLCDFGSGGGAACSVLPDVARVIKEFHAAKKPIGVVCIAPVLVARVLGSAMGGPGVSVTIGSDEGTAAAIAKMGSTNVPKKVTEACVDRANRIFSTPAYMCEATPHEVFEGVGRLVDELAGSLAR